MAARATPPASCLASAQPCRSRQRPRPRFVRIPSASASASASATHAARSDESLTSTLESLTFAEAEDIDVLVGGVSGDGASPSSSAPEPSASPTRQNYLQETTGGRRKSKPINIAAPKRQSAYTPLSARGDEPGGYFPNHETLLRQYKPHPFFQKQDSVPSSPIMSNASSSLSSPSSGTPQVSQSILSTTHSNIPSPDVLAIPMGKYYPSNYKPVSPSVVAGPNPVASPTPPAQLEIPSLGKKKKRPAHQRHTSDVKRKLQQYQRDMIAQAKLAGLADPSERSGNAKPSSPKLQPLGSQGPITPLELEESTEYMAAGTRGTDREREAVVRMIDQERNGSGSGSPVLSV